MKSASYFFKSSQLYPTYGAGALTSALGDTFSALIDVMVLKTPWCMIWLLRFRLNLCDPNWLVKICDLIFARTWFARIGGSCMFCMFIWSWVCARLDIGSIELLRLRRWSVLCWESWLQLPFVKTGILMLPLFGFRVETNLFGKSMADLAGS